MNLMSVLLITLAVNSVTLYVVYRLINHVERLQTLIHKAVIQPTVIPVKRGPGRPRKDGARW